ncbi:hypothetical protein [Thalassospira lucentensis]|nr:hypothetical protein [Thalassospira lucentensis]
MSDIDDNKEEDVTHETPSADIAHNGQTGATMFPECAQTMPSPQ